MLTPQKVVAGVVGALILCAILGIWLPFLLGIDLLKGLGALAYLIWSLNPIGVMVAIGLGYLGFLIFTSVSKKASRQPNPIEQFQERQPHGSAGLAGRSDLADALRGNGADLAPKFDD